MGRRISVRVNAWVNTTQTRRTPRALPRAQLGGLACSRCSPAPPGERHDLGLLSFGVALRELGWRVTYLGADTPIETIARAAEDLRPDAIVLAALSAGPVEECASEVAVAEQPDPGADWRRGRR